MTEPTATMIDVDRINTYYGDSHVLFDVSMQVREREVVALLGRNGAGKSTTLKTLAGVLRPRSGAIRFGGATIEQLPSYQIARLGLQLVPEERRIFGALTVAENLDIAALSVREPLPLDDIYTIFPRLAERRRNRGNQLSGGEQQMLAIGRALMGNPALLLMDEPLEGLAPVIVDALLSGLDRLKREDDLALLLVEQHARLALEFAEQVIILDRGAVVFSGLSRALLDAPERLASLIGVGRH